MGSVCLSFELQSERIQQFANVVRGSEVTRCHGRSDLTCSVSRRDCGIRADGSGSGSAHDMAIRHAGCGIGKGVHAGPRTQIRLDPRARLTGGHVKVAQRPMAEMRQGVLALAVSVLMCWGSTCGAQTVPGCGSLQNAFGPFDYRDPVSRGE